MATFRICIAPPGGPGDASSDHGLDAMICKRYDVDVPGWGTGGEGEGHDAEIARKRKSGHPESNQGPSDYCENLQSDALPTEL